MATVELGPGEEYEFDGVKIHAVYDGKEHHTFVTLDGWKTREFDLEVDEAGGHIDGIDYERQAPPEENLRAFAAIAIFARQKAPQVIGIEIITVEDPDGNLL
jgi:hypothetical protein